MNFFTKIAEGIKKTRDSMMSKVNSLLNSFTKIDEDFFEELEETLIMCDIGAATSADICEQLRKRVKEKGITDPALIKGELKDIIAGMLGEDKGLDLSTKPSVILVIGVNGAGKTTTIGKLAAKFFCEHKKVIVAAADTFRAAAIDQLQIWADRANADIVKHSEGSDPAAVVFDAINAAKARNADVVICDTAGRLHNKKNLMEELKKITRICRQQSEGCSVETLLVLDSTTGQNAVNQARLFSEAADITGIVLTKLDGTAKGGIIIPIHRELGIPVKYVGVGEKIDDLMEFSAEDYASALFDDDTDFTGNYTPITEDGGAAAEEEEENAAAPEETDIEETEENTCACAADTENEPREEENRSADIPYEAGVKAEAQSEAEEEADGTGENETDGDDGNTSAEKKSVKDGKFGFLFKEITFGKKKKGTDGDDNDDTKG